MSSRLMVNTLKAAMSNCLIPGTKAHQHGVTVSTKKEKGEIILVFLIDNDEGRKSLNMTAKGVQICDFLYCYAKYSIKEEIICLLELKGRNIEEAASQVLDTRKYLETLAKTKFGNTFQQLTLKACICFNGTSPRGGQRAKDDLKKIFGNDNVCLKHGPRHDIGPFLRKQ